jgi:hypothetical protein
MATLVEPTHSRPPGTARYQDDSMSKFAVVQYEYDAAQKENVRVLVPVRILPRVHNDGLLNVVLENGVFWSGIHPSRLRGSNE